MFFLEGKVKGLQCKVKTLKDEGHQDGKANLTWWGNNNIKVHKIDIGYLQAMIIVDGQAYDVPVRNKQWLRKL